jgi:hypothetical protein
MILSYILVSRPLSLSVYKCVERDSLSSIASCRILCYWSFSSHTATFSMLTGIILMVGESLWLSKYQKMYLLIEQCATLNLAKCVYSKFGVTFPHKYPYQFTIHWGYH